MRNVNDAARLALPLHRSRAMRNVALVALVAFVSVSSSIVAVGCGDASSTGAIRGGIPKPGDPTAHDPNDVDQGGTDEGNPNAAAPPPPAADPGGQGTAFSLALSATNPAVDLGAKTSIDVTVTQVGTFAGDVDLTATGLPAGVTAVFTPAKVTVGATPVVAKLEIASDYTAVPSAVGAVVPLQIMAKSGSDQTTANANFKVNPRLTLTVPLNVDALRQAGVGAQFRNEWGTAFGTTPVTMKTQTNNGIVVVVRNADSAPHIVHGAGAFPHGDTARPIPPNDYETLADGTMRTRTLTPTATTPVNVSGYPHDGADGPSVSFRMTVQAAP